MEGAPVSSYMVQTNSDVTNVRATWPDGFVDEMAPVNGWAMVAHTGANRTYTLEAVLADGSTLPLIEQFQRRLLVPGPVPAPASAAARTAAGRQGATHRRRNRITQGVTDAYQYVFTHGNDPSNNALYLEDAKNLKTAGDQAKANFPQASDTVTVEVGEIPLPVSDRGRAVLRAQVRGPARCSASRSATPSSSTAIG